MKKIALLFLVILFVFSCSYESKEKTNLGLRIREIEVAGGGPEEKIEVYKEFINKEEKNVIKVINSVDKKARFFSLIGLEFIKLNQYGPAIEYFNQVLEINPTNYLSHFYLGIASYNMGKELKNKEEVKKYVELSEASFLKAIEIKDDFKEALFALSNMYVYDLNKQTEARGYLNRLENIGEDYFEFWMLRGANYYSLSDLNNAHIVYEKARNKAETDEQKLGLKKIMSNLK